MVQTTRIQQGSGTLQSASIAAEANRTGRLNGQSVSVIAEVDVDDQIQLERFKRETGLDGSLDHKQLADRRLGLGQRTGTMDGAALNRFTRAFGNSKTSARLAQSYLQNLLGKEARPRRDANPSELVNHFVALQKLATALRGNDEQFVAQLTPLKEGADSLSALAEKLREAGDDAKAMQEQLADIEGMPEEQEQLGSMMKTLRFQPDQLKRKLRDAQKLPDPDARTRQELLEQVEDDLQEIQRQHGSHFRAIDHALRNAGDQASAEIAGSYDALVHDVRPGFARTLEQLLSQHAPAELRSKVMPLLEKTLANELGLGQDQRSIDKVKLEALLNELAHLHISTTLLEKTGSLVASMKRIYGVPA